jgi:hypothetical protein
MIPDRAAEAGDGISRVHEVAVRALDTGLLYILHIAEVRDVIRDDPQCPAGSVYMENNVQVVKGWHFMNDA